MNQTGVFSGKIYYRRVLAFVILVCIVFLNCSCVASDSGWIKTLDPKSEQGLNYIEDQIANQLESYNDEYILEYVECVYYSQEYIDELLYNSQTNNYFGYDYDEIVSAMGDKDWTFTVQDGKTVVVEVQDPNDALEQLVKKVAIGTGVIVVCAVISVVGGGAPIACFFAGAAKTALVSAVDGALVGGAIGAIIGGIQTGTWEGAADSAIKAAGDGFLWGAISGALIGGFNSVSCFTGDTLVKKDSGYTPISDISIGDMVWAYDRQSGTYGHYPVTNLFVSNASNLLVLEIGNEILRVTPEHPFLTERGWVDANDLIVGDRIASADGYTVVRSIDFISCDETVFNLEVEYVHTYTVTESDFTVHNKCNINSKYAGKNKQLDNPKLQKKYPNGVDFDTNGYARFEPYAKSTLEFNPGELTGKYYHDFKLANQRLGIKSTPKGYTWHHVEDGRTLILIPSDLHRAVRHTGGASLLRALQLK